MIKDISNYNNINDYLPILNAVLFTDLFVIILLNSNIIKSEVLRKWYSDFNLLAIIADVLIIVLVLIITRAIYYKIFTKFSIINFIILAVIIQIIHDILFYILFTIIPRGNNKIIDIFKDYAIEISFYAIIADSCMIIMSCLLAYYFVNISINTNIIILIVLVYSIPYLINNY